MPTFTRLFLGKLCLLSCLLTLSLAASADETAPASNPDPAKWYLSVSPYMHHWYPKPEHRYVFLLGVERYDTDNSVMGVAVFRNSYGDPTIYTYPWGQTYPHLWGIEKLSGKWSAGLLYGYVGQWKDKVPFNYKGFSPAFIPALSWDLGSGYEFQLNFPSGNVMFQLQIPLSASAKK